MTDKDKTYELIVKHLNNELPEEERQVFEDELSNDSLLNGRLQQLRAFWNNYFPKTPKHNIINKTEEKLGFTKYSKSKTNSLNGIKVAASILLILSLTYAVYHISQPEVQVTLNEYICPRGETKRITLSDGTLVWLNSGSFLIANEPFIGNNREVKLLGEGYFEVAHNPEQPFIVNTPFLETRVVGTHFNIAARNPNEQQEISLYEGEVKLITKGNKHEVILIPGEKACFSPETEKIKVKKAILSKPAPWRNGILSFYNEELFNISKELEYTYNTRIFIADSLVGRLRFTAEFEDESPEKIIDILSQAKEFNYEITNNGIFIQSKK